MTSEKIVDTLKKVAVVVSKHPDEETRNDMLLALQAAISAVKEQEEATKK